MDKVLKNFLEEKKRKHLEYLGLYKNCDEKVNEIQNEIDEIEQSDIYNDQKLLKLRQDLDCYYKNYDNHWYMKGEPIDLIEMSQSDYDELCKIYPPYITDIIDIKKSICEIKSYLKKIEFNTGL